MSVIKTESQEWRPIEPYRPDTDWNARDARLMEVAGYILGILKSNADKWEAAIILDLAGKEIVSEENLQETLYGDVSPEIKSMAHDFMRVMAERKLNVHEAGCIAHMMMDSVVKCERKAGRKHERADECSGGRRTDRNI